MDDDDTMEKKEEIAEYIDAVMEDSETDLMKDALGDIARAKGMKEIAKEDGIRTRKYIKSDIDDGNTEFKNVERVMKDIEIRL